MPLDRLGYRPRPRSRQSCRRFTRYSRLVGFGEAHGERHHGNHSHAGSQDQERLRPAQALGLEQKPGGHRSGVPARPDHSGDRSKRLLVDKRLDGIGGPFRHLHKKAEQDQRADRDRQRRLLGEEHQGEAFQEEDASKNPHPESVDNLRIPMGEGITGWVAEKREAVAIAQGAMRDKRFRGFSQLPEDSFEAFLSAPILAGGRLIGVLNLQHRKRHAHSPQEVKLVSTIGHLVGAEIERARLDSEVTKLTGQLETRKLLERAKGILQRDLGLTEEQAYLKLQQESRRRRIPMKQVAEAVVLSDDLRRAHRGS